MQNHKSINLNRKILRYTLAAILTAVIVGTVEFLYYQEQFANRTIDYSKLYMYQKGWLEFCGLILSMLVIPILIYALAKQFILRSNENFWQNTLLFFCLTLLFFLVIASLTWGISLNEETSAVKLFFDFGPLILFPSILLLLKKLVKPVND